MLTGLYPFIHRSVYNGAPLDKRFTNIAKEVRKLNYNPSLYGYTDTSWDPRYLEPKDKKNFTYESPMEGFEDGWVEGRCDGLEDVGDNDGDEDG